MGRSPFSLQGSSDPYRAWAFIGLPTLIWSVMAIELTLKWNGITNVYQLNTTGQIIPFVIGLSLFANVCWRLLDSKRVSPYLIYQKFKNYPTDKA